MDINIYETEVTVKKTYIAVKTFTIEVEAESEESAMALAEEKADIDEDVGISDADHEDTDIEVTGIKFVRVIEQDKTIERCKKTIDMFGENN